MSKAINSPTGRLLRSSRLFSLPPPLPAAPPQGTSISRMVRHSDTATTPYPTHQAIATPASSRSRGDWGLKRPLPSRAIPSAAPHLRIKAIDTLEHITDFESAADHTQSLAKWQEMNIPLSVHASRSTMSGSDRRNNMPSAFSADYDNTSLANQDTTFTADRAIKQRSLQATRGRWKTQGPWLAGMSEDEFQRYLVKAVRQHKDEFRKFLGAAKVEKNRKQLLETMRTTGELANASPDTIELELHRQSRLHPRELDDYIKDLRDDCDNLRSELPQLICEFFDLPPFPKSTTHFSSTDSKADNAAATLAKNISQSLDSTAETGPPATHPSAGLSYLLTKAVADNHPLYGPQEEREPVLSRVLRPKSINSARESRATVGVGGFVTSVATANTTFKGNKSPLVSLDIDVPGGNKQWMQPLSASIDERGRVRLDVEVANEKAVGVKTGNPVEEAAPSYSSQPGRMNEPLDSPAPGTRGNANFGRAQPNERLPRADAFDVKSSRDSQNEQGLEAIAALAKQAGVGRQQ